MSFEWPLALIALLPTAALLGWGWRRRRPRSDAPWYRNAAPRGPLIAFGLGLALLVAATARPVADVALPRIDSTLVIAVDNSNSMLADDAEPTRIERARTLAHELVDAQGATVKVGIVAFSSGGVVLLEPTTDHERAHDTIDRIRAEGGTSLADGLFAALGAVIGGPIEVTDEAIDAGDITLVDIGYHSGDVVVLLTDGENRNGADPVQVAGLAANAGIRVFPVGVGQGGGTTVDLDGFTIATALDDRRLQRIADATGATYAPATAGLDLDAIDDATELGLTIRGERTEITALVAGLGTIIALGAAAWTVLRNGRIL